MAERAPDLDTRIHDRDPGTVGEDPAMTGGHVVHAAPDTTVDLAAAMGAVARHLHSAASIDQVITRVLDTCVAMIDGCAHAGVSMLPARGQVRPQARSPLARALDELQYELDEGPGLQAVRKNCTLHVSDLGADPRWPRFGPLAADLGAGSMLACRLFTNGRATAAINLYGATPHAFGTADQDAATVLAVHASVAIDSARTRAQLNEAIRTRQVIGEAVGILKERHQVSSQDAFRQLRVTSQALNVKLRVIAEHLTADTGPPLG
jgi:GAF domain-containing protein